MWCVGCVPLGRWRGFSLCSFTLLPFVLSERAQRAKILRFRRGWSSTGSGPGGGSARVLRGGAFNNDPDNLRCSNRNYNVPGNRNNNYGFRVVCGVCSARKVLIRASGERRARCGVGHRPAPPVPRSHLNRRTHAPRGEKTRRRPWPVTAALRGGVRESHGLYSSGARRSRHFPARVRQRARIFRRRPPGRKNIAQRFRDSATNNSP